MTSSRDRCVFIFYLASLAIIITLLESTFSFKFAQAQHCQAPLFKSNRLASFKTSQNNGKEESKENTTHNKLKQTTQNNHKSKSKNRISGGFTVAEGQFPAFASLLIKFQRETNICSGVLISDRHILTAGHCIYSSFARVSSIEVSFGVNAPSSWRGSDTKKYRAKRWCLSSRYSNGWLGASTSDFAVITLDEIVEFSDFLQPACKPSRRVNEQDECYSLGIGKTDEISFPRSLQALQVRKVWCYDEIGFDRSRICFSATNNGGDSCSGDSGGPAMCNIVDEAGKPSWQVHGLVSYGEKMCVSRNGRQQTYFDTQRQWHQVEQLMNSCT